MMQMSPITIPELDHQVKETRDAIENLLNDKFSAKSGSTLDLEKANVALRKEIEQVKSWLKNSPCAVSQPLRNNIVRTDTVPLLFSSVGNVFCSRKNQYL